MQNTQADQSTNLVSTSFIAKLFRVTSRHIQQLTQDKVLQATIIKGSNKYDLLPTVETYVKHLNDKIKGKEQKRGSKDEERKLEAEADFKRSKADIAALQLQELEGKMHRSEDVEAMTTDLCLTIRNALLSLPGRISVDLSKIDTATEISEYIKQELNDILEELSNYKYNPAEYRRRVRERQGWLEEDGEEDNEE